MSELFGDLMRGHVPAKRPLINGSATSVVDHGEILVAHAHADAVAVCVEMPADEIRVAEGSAHEDIRLAATLNQITQYGLAIAHHVLGGGGFVIHIASVDAGAVIEEVFCNVDRAGKMERSLAIRSEERRVGTG